jgi:hypothetical protein
VAERNSRREAEGKKAGEESGADEVDGWGGGGEGWIRSKILSMPDPQYNGAVRQLRMRGEATGIATGWDWDESEEEEAKETEAALSAGGAEESSRNRSELQGLGSWVGAVGDRNSNISGFL